LSDTVITHNISHIWPIIDKTYSSKAAAAAAVREDNIMVGRFVLIEYTQDLELPLEIKDKI
jgi:hypothetical protein